MTNQERGRRTGQHDQPEQQAVMFRGCCEAVEAMAPRPARIETALRIQSDILALEEMIAAMFTHPDRIHIEYEMQCEVCMTWTTSARRKETRGGTLIVCLDCE